MRFDRFFTKLFCQPVLLESAHRSGLELALLSLMERGDADGAQLRKISADRAEKRAGEILEIRGATAIIHIDGAIDKNLSAIDRLCLEATDLNDVDKAISQVKDQSSIMQVIFAFDSPGGTFPGVPETAAEIASLSKEKHTVAFCSGMACSAAYWLASQCDEICATPSASVGSIGVYVAVLDQSRRLDSMGLKMQEIKSGDLKTAGAPWKPLSDDEKAHLQGRIDQIGAMFRGTILSKRPDIGAESMRGQSLLAQEALSAGLIDSICSSLDSAIRGNSMRKSPKGSARLATQPLEKKDPPKTAKPTMTTPKTQSKLAHYLTLEGKEKTRYFMAHKAALTEEAERAEGLAPTGHDHIAYHGPSRARMAPASPAPEDVLTITGDEHEKARALLASYELLEGKEKAQFFRDNRAALLDADALINGRSGEENEE